MVLLHVLIETIPIKFHSITDQALSEHNHTTCWNSKVKETPVLFCDPCLPLHHFPGIRGAFDLGQGLCEYLSEFWLWALFWEP